MKKLLVALMSVGSLSSFASASQLQDSICIGYKVEEEGIIMGKIHHKIVCQTKSFETEVLFNAGLLNRRTKMAEINLHNLMGRKKYKEMMIYKPGDPDDKRSSFPGLVENFPTLRVFKPESNQAIQDICVVTKSKTRKEGFNPARNAFNAVISCSDGRSTEYVPGITNKELTEYLGDYKYTMKFKSPKPMWSANDQMRAGGDDYTLIFEK